MAHQITPAPDLASSLGFRPLGNRVALRRLTDQPASQSSAWLVPDAAKEKALECEVVAIPDHPYISDYGTLFVCPVAVGDLVLIGKYTAGEHRVRNADGVEEEVLYLRWEELLAVRPSQASLQARAELEAAMGNLRGGGKLEYYSGEAHNRRATPRYPPPDPADQADAKLGGPGGLGTPGGPNRSDL